MRKLLPYYPLSLYCFPFFSLVLISCVVFSLVMSRMWLSSLVILSLLKSHPNFAHFPLLFFTSSFPPLLLLLSLSSLVIPPYLPYLPIISTIKITPPVVVLAHATKQRKPSSTCYIQACMSPMLLIITIATTYC